jgi:cysteine-rich repeat protein
MPARTLIERNLRRSGKSQLAQLAFDLAVALAAVQATACSGGKDELPPATTNDPPPNPTPDTGAPPVGEDASGTGGAGGTGGSGGGSGAGGFAGQGGSGRDGSVGPSDGGARDGSVAVCGNGVLEADESCDGTDFGAAGASCERVGYSRGVLTCALNCTFDKSQCTGVEVCDDMRDNDGDDAVDCSDSDCADVCANPCGSAAMISDPATVLGSTEGRAKTMDPTCKDPTGPSGAEIVYRFTAQNTGKLDVLLSSANQLTVSIRAACASPATESACAPVGKRLVTPIAKDQTVFVVVDGYEAQAAGKFDLLVKSRPIRCGDAMRDDPEECDDGDDQPGDGCNASCQVETSEIEPNATPATASPRGTGAYFFGRVFPSGDVDVIKVDVPGPASRLTVNTFDFGDGACGAELLDSTIDILRPDGTTVAASDDDSGDGFCARATVPSLAQGMYFVRIAASPQGETPTFPYVLHVAIE